MDDRGPRNARMAERIGATAVRYPFSFVIAGDSGARPDPTADAIFAQLLRQTAELRRTPVFFANLGDSLSVPNVPRAASPSTAPRAKSASSATPRRRTPPAPASRRCGSSTKRSRPRPSRTASCIEITMRELRWLPVVLVGGIAGAAVLLATVDRGPTRWAVVAGAIGLLLIAPAVWSYQTLGHPANGTFPVGGPASHATVGGAGGPRGTTAAKRHGGNRAGRGGGAIHRIEAALAYIDAHGGGTLAVSRQSGAAARIIIQTGADVAGIGGFSGRESHVSVGWFADAVERGEIRCVLIGDPGRYGGRDGRIGSGTVMWAVRQVGAKTPMRRLYDVSGRADALRALGSGAPGGLRQLSAKDASGSTFTSR